jgi:hypothetical protein
MATATRAPRQQGPDTTQSAASLAATRQRNNAMFLEHSIQQRALLVPSSGSGQNLPYSSGGTLLFDVPTADGAFLEGILFICNLSVVVATTGGTPAMNAVGALGLFDTIEVVYGQTQAKLPPFLLKYWEQLMGYERPAIGQVIAGQSDSNVQDAVWSTFPVTAGTNPWNFYFYLPLRALPYGPAGMLPIQGKSTKAQVKVNCAQTSLGVDPRLNTITIAGGTGNSVTVSGTVQGVACYRDGVTLAQRDPLALDLAGEPTVQWNIDRQLQNVVANMPQRTMLDSKYEHAAMFGIIIDGNQSNKFAVKSNILGLAIDEDSVGRNKLFAVGTSAGTNIPMMEYWYRQRHRIGQDIDDGVIPWHLAPTFNQVNPSNLLGASYFNMTPGAWSDANLEIYLSTVGGVGGIAPRMEVYELVVNRAGLVSVNASN